MYGNSKNKPSLYPKENMFSQKILENISYKKLICLKLMTSEIQLFLYKQ